MRTRAKAAMISTFIETAINPKFIRNNYHNQLFRCHVLIEQGPALKAPPYFDKEFFENICKLRLATAKIEEVSIKQVYNFLMPHILKDEIVPPFNESPTPISEWPIKPLKCETYCPETDWKMS